MASPNTVVYLRGVTKGKAFDMPEARKQLNQKTCRYVPHIMIVPQGKPLRIESSDPVLHTVQMFGVSTNNIPFPFQNQFIPVMMNHNGVVELKCNAGHVWMNANVLVVKHPYYAVTDDHGAFKLSDVPPGEYEDRGVARGLAGRVRGESAGCGRAGGSEAPDLQPAGDVGEESDGEAGRTYCGGFHDFREARIGCGFGRTSRELSGQAPPL